MLLCRNVRRSNIGAGLWLFYIRLTLCVCMAQTSHQSAKWFKVCQLRASAPVRGYRLSVRRQRRRRDMLKKSVLLFHLFCSDTNFYVTLTRRDMVLSGSPQIICPHPLPIVSRLCHAARWLWQEQSVTAPALCPPLFSLLLCFWCLCLIPFLKRAQGLTCTEVSSRSTLLYVDFYYFLWRCFWSVAPVSPGLKKDAWQQWTEWEWGQTFCPFNLSPIHLKLDLWPFKSWLNTVSYLQTGFA